jgi:hypothetical protein
MAVIAPDNRHTVAETETSETETSEARTEARALFAHFDGVDAFLATFEPARYSTEDAAELLSRITRHERRVVAAKTLVAARVAEGHLHLRTGHRTPAEFMAATTGDSLAETKDLIRLGENLADQPALAGSFLDGRLSRRRAALVSDAARVNPGREADLVKGAETDSEAGVKERCLRAKAEGRTQQEAARHHERLHQDRSATTWTDTDGAFALRATLTPEAGAELQAALEAEADRHFDRARSEGRMENPAAYRADALVALVTGRGIVGPRKKKQTPDTEPPVPTRDRRATVNVVVDLETLRQGNVQPGGRCEIPGVGPVSVDWVRELLGQCLFNAFVTSATDIHAVWSPKRRLPRDLRAGIVLRDPRCVVPGCDARLGLECDHWVTDFAEGGLTALDNLARICKRHHRQRTHQGFELRRGPKGWEWIPPATPNVPKRPKKKKSRKVTGTAPPPTGTGPPLFDPEE